MNKLIILHLTDFHFGDNTKIGSKETAELISREIKNHYSHNEYDIIIALGGDIANKANGLKYQYAHEFLNSIINQFVNYTLHFLLCPGNHDIENNSSSVFSNFNTFSRELRKNSNIIYNSDKTCVLEEINEFSFICVNSSYEEDQKYGSIEIAQLDKCLKNAKYPIIILTHHHLIPIYSNDCSTTRNSYDFFKSLNKYNVKYILHGHIHKNSRIEICNIDVVGTSALFPCLDTGHNNSFSIIELKKVINQDDVKQFRIILDGTGGKKLTTIK
ncbi:metallophosphoesterase [Flavobacterium sp. W22_SRS_FK3]|uniref:metallophosphoesterase family protein n=1 Tax=Flavobacterium sp. W22_SRS_FK3 TaxID=3240275 RepID=UPI003F91EECF